MYELRFILFCRFFAFLAIFLLFFHITASYGKQWNRTCSKSKSICQEAFCTFGLLYHWQTLRNPHLVGAQESGESKESREEMLHLNSCCTCFDGISSIWCCLWKNTQFQATGCGFQNGSDVAAPYNLQYHMIHIYIYIMYIMYICIYVYI